MVLPPNNKNRIKGQKQRVKGRDIPEMSNYAKIISLIMDMVKNHNLTLLAEITEEIRNDPLLSECMRKIQPD